MVFLSPAQVRPGTAYVPRSGCDTTAFSGRNVEAGDSGDGSRSVFRPSSSHPVQRKQRQMNRHKKKIYLCYEAKLVCYWYIIKRALDIVWTGPLWLEASRTNLSEFNLLK